MSNKINGCMWFMQAQPDFRKKVKHPETGDVIGTIHAFTANDKAKIKDLKKVIYHGTNSFELVGNPYRVETEEIYLALTGVEDCGWKVSAEITRENIGNLTETIRKAFLDAIDELKKAFSDNQEAIEKN